MADASPTDVSFVLPTDSPVISEQFGPVANADMLPQPSSTAASDQQRGQPSPPSPPPVPVQPDPNQGLPQIDPAQLIEFQPQGPQGQQGAQQQVAIPTFTISSNQPINIQGVLASPYPTSTFSPSTPGDSSGVSMLSLGVINIVAIFGCVVIAMVGVAVYRRKLSKSKQYENQVIEEIVSSSPPALDALPSYVVHAPVKASAPVVSRSRSATPGSGNRRSSSTGSTGRRNGSRSRSRSRK
ncbi:UNVERIFIED_CONTAM: hypothetical protein HDU68_012792 [Siphonaria sp. JEL0065]|nr:hypothetical protein HDU68_012792 [Siphonaria sp. JEL0065]